MSYRHSQLDNGGNEWIRKDNARDFSTVNPLNVSIFNDRQVDGVILQGDYRPGSVALTSVSSYTRRDVKFLWDADFSAAEGLLATEGSRRVGNVYTQELRLASDNDSRFDWLVGAYFADVENRLITNSADVFIGPDSPIYPFVNPEGNGEYFQVPDFNNADVLERQYAGFVSVNYRFGDFRLGGGARINRSDYTGRRLNEDLRLVNNETRLLPKLTMSYDFGDSMAYANISRGAEPGKANVTGDLTDLYRAEIITQYEVGIKGQSADRRFIYEVAAFFLQSKDRQQELVLTDSTGTAVPRITNAGDSRSYGIEGSVTWRPVTGLTLSLGGGWLNAKWRNGIVTSADLLDPDVLVDTPLRGKDVPVSPKFTGNASIDWRMPAGDGIEAGARADLARQGSLYWDLRNLSYQKAYNVVNLSLFAASMDNRWNLTFRVENLFQQRYFNVFNLGFDGEPDANGNCDMCSVGTLGSPRRALASLAFNL